MENDVGYVGESGVEDPGCLWYIDVTGEEATPCSECSFAVQLTFSESYIEEDEDCPEGYHHEDYVDTHPIIGFGNGSAWINKDDDWEEFAFYFQEDVYHIWFVPFD